MVCQKRFPVSRLFPLFGWVPGGGLFFPLPLGMGDGRRLPLCADGYFSPYDVLFRAFLHVFPPYQFPCHSTCHLHSLSHCSHATPVVVARRAVVHRKAPHLVGRFPEHGPPLDCRPASQPHRKHLHLPNPCLHHLCSPSLPPFTIIPT